MYGNNAMGRGVLSWLMVGCVKLVDGEMYLGGSPQEKLGGGVGMAFSIIVAMWLEANPMGNLWNLLLLGPAEAGSLVGFQGYYSPFQ